MCRCPAVGVIAEYNPFHNGHLYHLQQAKRMTGREYAVVVMSGNFVQRGEPAVVDKYARTRMALLSGADVVLELPVYYATASAEYFAYGAVRLLQASGITDTLCFGSECGDIRPLKDAAVRLSSEDASFRERLMERLSRGDSYPKARAEAFQKAAAETGGSHAPFVSEPNDILGVEYLKALFKCGAGIEPFTIRRFAADYHDESIPQSFFDGVPVIASATAIRKVFLGNNPAIAQKAIPSHCYQIYHEKAESGLAPKQLDQFSQIFQYIIRKKEPADLQNILDVTEGLENRITQTANKYFHLNTIIPQIKTKRYTFTKIQRTILHILLDITKDDFERYQALGGPQYLRVLGFRKESTCLLGEMKQNASLPMITNIKNAVLHPDGTSMLRKEMETTDLYYLAGGECGEFSTERRIEYRMPLVIV